MDILIGTNNKNKLAQFAQIFTGLDPNIKLFSLQDLGITDDVEEDSDSLLDNAKKKAKHYAEESKMLTVADDTGLFIDALNGEPGVHAKRWYEGTDKDRYLKILEKMQGISEDKRTCRYTGALAAYDPEKSEFWTFQKNIEGKIADNPLEGGGFGYDPIFVCLAYGKRYSQLTDEEKNVISHRGLGAKELLKYLGVLS